MKGYCPQCAKREGAHSHAGVVQKWTKPVLVLKHVPPSMPRSLVPQITMGECGHTVSLREWKSFNARSTVYV